MSSKEFVINVSGLSKSFAGKVAVRDLDLQVEKGEIVGFLGSNGSGKTTSIRMLCGLLIPDKGTGDCLGFDIINQSHEIKKHVGYMPQAFSLYEDLTIYENLDFFARVYGLENRKQRIMQCIERLGLSAGRNKLAGALSGGWKQRLSLAAALLHDPQLLLFDEPTAGVDPMARGEFWDEIHRLTANGITALVSTHYIDEAERCHRLAHISHGRLLMFGTIDEIIAHAGLVVWHVTGSDITKLSDQLRQLDAVEQVISFGRVLHISGINARAIQKEIAPFQAAPYHWRQAEPSLEDIFIRLAGHGDHTYAN